MRLKPNLIVLSFIGWVIVTGAGATQTATDEYEIVDGGIPQSLSGEPGNPLRGELVVRDAANASCLICHQMPIPEEPNHGNIGPDLTGVANRFTEAELRLRIVDPKALNPSSLMPAYYSAANLRRVESQYVGQTIYSAQDVEDVVAYLITLTEQP